MLTRRSALGSFGLIFFDEEAPSTNDLRVPADAPGVRLIASLTPGEEPLRVVVGLRVPGEFAAGPGILPPMSLNPDGRLVPLTSFLPAPVFVVVESGDFEPGVEDLVSPGVAFGDEDDPLGLTVITRGLFAIGFLS